MDAITIAQPGSETGPCTVTCGHLDCLSRRLIAGCQCPHCDKMIGYDTPYYRLGIQTTKRFVYTHASCHDESMEERDRTTP